MMRSFPPPDVVAAMDGCGIKRMTANAALRMIAVCALDS